MYKPEQFNQCVFNPLVKKEMLREHPRLSEISPTDSDNLPHFDKILRYVCLLYDPKSPLILNERDLNYRKGVAAELAGFDTECDDEFLQGVYSHLTEWVVTLIMRYLIRFIKQRDWIYLVALEMKYYEGISRLMRPIEKVTGGKDWDELKAVEVKAKISDELYKDLSRLDTLYKKFFNEEGSLEDATKNMRVTPESIAKLK